MRTAAQRAPLSLITALAVWSIIAVALIGRPPANILSWDTFGYYLYLPATFIHHDPALTDAGWVHEVMERYSSTGSFYQAQQQPGGGWVLKYPMGMAVLWLPFFLLGHVAALATGAPADGFSAPYQWAIICALLSYALIGLLVLRRVLLKWFDEAITAAVLALVVMGTNYLHQALYSTGMPHVFLFTLYAGVLWYTIAWHRDHWRGDALKLALLMGLMVLARPSEAVCVLIPLLYGLGRAGNWREHFVRLWVWKRQLLLVAVVLFLVGAPQLLYWKWLTGKFLYMSYNNPGEGFEFLHPYVRQVLFSFRKGWFIYTPLMAVATAGLFRLRSTVPQMQWSISAFFLLNLYVVSSWSCWWYADSFGQRALVQSYAVMALPLGSMLLWLKARSSLVRAAGVAVILGLTACNLFQIHQSTLGLIHTSRMTWPAYKAVFGKTSRPEGLDALLLIDRDQRSFTERPDLHGHDPVMARTLRAQRSDQRELRISLPWAEASDRDHVWVEANCWFREGSGDEGSSVELVTAMEHGGYPYHERIVTGKAVRDSAGTLGLEMWYLTPEVRDPSDRLHVICRSKSGPLALDSLVMRIHEPRFELSRDRE